MEIKGVASAAQIESWKREFSDIYTAEAEDGIAYFKKPSRQQLGYAMTLKSDPLKMTETILKGCFVGGDERFINETDYMLGAASIVELLIQAKEVKLKKL